MTLVSTIHHLTHQIDSRVSLCSQRCDRDFENTNTLTTHVGTVKSFDSNTNILETTFENVIRVEQEQDELSMRV